MPDRLLLDTMCGTLATYLRMCGYDAADAMDDAAEPPSDEALIERAADEGRRIVTRDRDLAARRDEAVPLTGRDVTDQLRELADAGFDLALPDEPVRCGACNGSLDAVAPTETTPTYAPDPTSSDVWRCPDCGQCFWRGSHWADVRGTLADL